ncbi:MAG: ABC transporter ATP-binding protein [Thermoleophilia bacterium]|nr:ABC transporter ATP-binding protein [Thermoleophilia bacterium]
MRRRDRTHTRTAIVKAQAYTGTVTPEQTTDAVISVRQVDKTYSSRQADVVALQGASLEIARHSFVSLVGPSGCGKSTLLKIIGGLIPITAGAVQVNGRHVTGPSRDVGMMFQTPTLFAWRTVLQNVMLPVEIFGLDKVEYEAKARGVLDMVGLRDFEKCYPRQLSGGMQQRVALSRVLIFEPHLLLMDEPFGALDEFNRERLNLEILRVWTEIKQTVLFVTHNIAEAVFLSDRLYVMSPAPGRIVGIIDVPLPRPRTFATMHEPPFADTIFQVRELLGVAG